MRWYWWALIGAGAFLLLGGGFVAYQIQEKGKPYLAAIKAAAARHGIPWELMAAEIWRESGFNPQARNPKSGALGLAQFMPATAAELGIDPLDPFQSIEGMARYLAQIRDYLAGKFGSVGWDMILAGYNWGMGNVRNAVQTWGQDWLSHAPAETRSYVSAIIGAAGSALA